MIAGIERHKLGTCNTGGDLLPHFKWDAQIAHRVQYQSGASNTAKVGRHVKVSTDPQEALCHFRRSRHPLSFVQRVLERLVGVRDKLRCEELPMRFVLASPAG